LNRIIVLVLLGGLASLMIDIRWEHRVELARRWETWIPLVYIGLMLLAGVVGLYRWESWGRMVLQVGFSLCLIVGALGTWFHSQKDPVGNFRRVLTAWTAPLGTNGGVKTGTTPPEMAPLAFIGLGLMGLLACSKCFQCEGDSSNLRDIAGLASVRRLCLVAFLIAASTWPTAAQAQQTESQQVAGASESQELRLSSEAAQVADEIGVAPLLVLLSGKRAAGSGVSLESLAIRQEITEKVLAASLDVDSVNAVVDSEIEQIRGIRADIQAKRDKAQNIINIASIATGGVAGAVTSALQFKPSTVNLGNGIGVGGGAGSVALSIVGIRMQGGRRSLGDSPRMLARFFGRPPDATEAIPSVYPEEVWSYLNSAAPSQPNMGTRREQLIAKWRSEGRLKQDGSPKGERRIEALSSNISRMRKLSINELSDRVAMLLDVRARVSLMKRGLSEILRALSAATSNQ
jgi:hypothetical protein